MAEERRPTVRRPAFPDMEDLRDLFRFDRWPLWPSTRSFQMFGEEMPAIDMFERNGNVIVKAEMPGIDPNKIDVTIVGDELRISGEREEEKEVNEEQYYRSERRYGRIHRSVTLPAGVDTDRVSATAKEGVLEVTIPKQEQAAGKKIEVKSA